MQGPEYYTQSFNATALGITVEDSDEGHTITTTTTTTTTTAAAATDVGGRCGQSYR